MGNQNESLPLGGAGTPRMPCGCKSRDDVLCAMECQLYTRSCDCECHYPEGYKPAAKGE